MQLIFLYNYYNNVLLLKCRVKYVSCKNNIPKIHSKIAFNLSLRLLIMNNLLQIMKIRKSIDEDNNNKNKKICTQKQLPKSSHYQLIIVNIKKETNLHKTQTIIYLFILYLPVCSCDSDYDDDELKVGLYMFTIFDNSNTIILWQELVP